jgi:hypothetical protein
MFFQTSWAITIADQNVDQVRSEAGFHFCACSAIEGTINTSNDKQKPYTQSVEAEGVEMTATLPIVLTQMGSVNRLSLMLTAQLVAGS